MKNLSINNFAYLMPIKIGTPAIWNLVAIDTGSTLSFVQCLPCTVNCHKQDVGAGQLFDPSKSSTIGRVGCSNVVCRAIQESLPVPTKACMEREDSCLYSMSYGRESSYSVGKIVTDRLTLGPNDEAVIAGFVFGCSLGTNYNKLEAGIMGFGAEAFSFFMQVSHFVGYEAFSYCFSSDRQKQGYLSIGNYSRTSSSYSTPMFVATPRPVFSKLPRSMYSLQLNSLSVNGITLHSDPYEMTVDSGTEMTLLLSDTFDELDNAVTQAVEPLGYMRTRSTIWSDNHICFEDKDFTPFKNWSALPVVELLFGSGAKLRVPPQSAFYNDGGHGLCMYFVRDAFFVKGMQILGNTVTQSIGITFDIQSEQFVFREGEC
ncbi:hypothetical protein CFC21_104843 [Triticum aestivum]|nr:hypothetical protein CFC21_104843 [Triticum aestivum]